MFYRQSKLGAFKESLTQVIIGYIVLLIAQSFFFPIYGLEVDFMVNLELAGIFTILSLIKHFILRMIFESRLVLKLENKKRIKKMERKLGKKVKKKVKSVN